MHSKYIANGVSLFKCLDFLIFIHINLTESLKLNFFKNAHYLTGKREIPVIIENQETRMLRGMPAVLDSF